MNARRRSILDLIRGDLSDLQRRLGTAERAKLDSHLESLRAVEQGLGPASAGGAATAPGATCSSPQRPSIANSQDNNLFPDVTKAMIDIAVQSLACGLTNVASVQASHTVSPTLPSWLSLSEAHHSLSHAGRGDDAAEQRFAKAENWFAQQFVYLVQQLKARANPAGGGSLLDDTVVLWAKEMGDSRNHDQLSVPFVVAGGGFPGGRYINCNGAFHGQLMVSICQQLGLANNTYGNPAAGTGPLGVLS